MHLHLCVILSSLVAASLATAIHQNVVLEESCWTSDSCREDFKLRFTGRVSTIQLRVPWHLLHPLFNQASIQHSIDDLITSARRVEPIFGFNHQAGVHELEEAAQEILKLNLTSSAFLLDSADATENLAIIARELSFINKVFRHAAKETRFYNIPPTSFLSSQQQHLHKYLSFVREHVTGIRIQVSRLPTGHNLADMLALINNRSLVAEVEVKDNRDMQIVTRLNMNQLPVYRSFAGSEDPHLRIRRAPSTINDNFNFNLNDDGENQRQAQLEKLFPSIGAAKKTPAVSWAERRLNAKRNLEKLLDKIASKKQTAAKTLVNLDTKSPELTRTLAKDGSSGIVLTEERIFQESDNPRFPKQDITVALIDRRGDVNAKDYDYVEFGNEKKEAFGDLSDEVGFAREQPKSRFYSKSATSASTPKTVRDMELWERETYPKAESHQHSSSSYLESHEEPEDDDGQPRNYYVNSEYQMADPKYYSEAGGVGASSPYQVLNYTSDQYYYPEQQEQYPSSRRQPHRRRIRRDIFSQSESGIHSLFEDIRDYYPNMLDRLSAAWRPKRDNDDVPAALFPSIGNHISDIWGGKKAGDSLSILGRKVRSSSFIRHDPSTNEIGYVKPVAPVTRPPIYKPKDEGSPTILSVFFKGWEAFQEQLKKMFL